MSQVLTSSNKFFTFWSLVRQSLRGDQYDYTQGSIRHAIILLAIPMILELSLESVFAVVTTGFARLTDGSAVTISSGDGATPQRETPPTARQSNEPAGAVGSGAPRERRARGEGNARPAPPQ